ncbi:MAG: hypothetical protein IM662_08100 [Phenylobacterium sp.]|uniref:hypothetical protein n=4 Tax=Phenylobacterium sp. TaxID=1871053 RepID=UPI0025D938EA|nr:hypothetical protein [Phenylobacterium sp.]MCA3745822.1 hypothetical protein [Phenylobacterium sp.]MCA3751256.1 hypothetical protein [Phenylobacterium sp.]MCA6277704.1 hypothetical protein [Phenylobacterium sp.]MCA6293380.1 hypothetical protein [Phenylobacterium sp.]
MRLATAPFAFHNPSLEPEPMTLENILAEGVHDADLPAVRRIAEVWSSLLRPDQVAGLKADDVQDRIVRLIEIGGLDENAQITLASTLRELSLLRSPALSPALVARMNSVCRPIFTRFADALAMAPRSLALPRIRAAHVLFVGSLQDTHDLPSTTAIDFAAVLALDPKVERIEIVHSGSITPDMSAYIQGALTSRREGLEVLLVSTLENENFMADILGRGPCAFHFCGESAFSPVISLASRLGPTLMYVASDDAPVQYADVYWTRRTQEEIVGLWNAQGAPAFFAANHIQTLQVPGRATPVPEPLPRAGLGLPEDALVIATVGDRLDADMDEAYITGIELAIRDRPDCIWLVAGELPDYLSDACQQVLGSQFLYIPEPSDLARLLTVVDVYANPFRAAGGSSARLAAAAGAAILTLDRGEVAAIAPPDFQGQDTEDYLRRLNALIALPDLLAALKGRQAEHFAQIGDQKALLASLQKMVRTAARRYGERGDGLPLSRTVFAPKGALAAAS